jgi:curved DNA-binding protein
MKKPFIDYYEFLQLSSSADLETIERVYRFLAKKIHPDNKETGNSEKFNLLTEAYKILSNPEKRAAYDVNYEEEKSKQWKAFSTISSSDGFESDKQIRHTILSILYVARRQDPSNSGVGNWQLENIMGRPEKTLDFHIWYLKEKNWIERTDVGGFAITASGVDEIEKDGVILRKDRLLSESVELSGDPEIIRLIAENGTESADEYENAINHLRRKIEADPGNLMLLMVLAYLLIKLGRDVEANESLKKIFSVDSNFSIDEFLSARNLKYPHIVSTISNHLKNAALV